MHIVRIWIHNYQFELVVGLGSNLDPGCNLRNVRERFLVFRQLLKLLERIQLPESIEKSQDVKHCHVSIRHLVHTKCWRPIHVSTGVGWQDNYYLFPDEEVTLHHFLEVCQHWRQLLLANNFRCAFLKQLHRLHQNKQFTALTSPTTTKPTVHKLHVCLQYNAGFPCVVDFNITWSLDLVWNKFWPCLLLSLWRFPSSSFWRHRCSRQWRQPSQLPPLSCQEDL